MLTTINSAITQRDADKVLSVMDQQKKKIRPNRTRRSMYGLRWYSGGVCLSIIVAAVVQLMLVGLTIVPNVVAEDVALEEEDFSAMSIMPVSCLNYLNGNVIKFQMFNHDYNFQCHSNSIGTYVVSISHYMRTYFNYQSILQGENFALPEDAGYLNCIRLAQTDNSDTKLYARVGCLERERFTSTKLQLHVYTDKKCSAPYDDGQSDDERARNGYLIEGEYFDTKVSFRPTFYKCNKCKPRSVSASFSREGTVWYDDDAEAKYRYFDDWIDDYVYNDDNYAAVQEYVNNEQRYYKEDDDDFYTQDDDNHDGDRRRRNLVAKRTKNFVPVQEELQQFERDFYTEQTRILSDTTDDSILQWDMCTNLSKYSLWCDATCQALDNFRIDEWSSSDLLLLFFMIGLLATTMALILSNREKVFERAHNLYSDDFSKAPDLGMPISTMGYLFAGMLGVVLGMAMMRLVNETLVVAAICCVGVFGYLVKLTFFATEEEGSLFMSGDTRTNYTLT